MRYNYKVRFLAIWVLASACAADLNGDRAIGTREMTVVSGEAITLDATALFGGAAAGFSWTQLDGPAVALPDPAAPMVTFTAPSVAAATLMIFKLAIESPEIDAIAVFTVTVLPTAAPVPQPDPSPSEPAPDPSETHAPSEPQPTPQPPAPEPPTVACVGAPGAGSGARALGRTTYDGSGTTTVSNVVFDGPHSDDLVRVYNGHVIFDRVTFRGTGTGSSGHTLEVKRGGSVEVRNSIFEGAPTEDHIQFHENRASVVRCSVFVTAPGEDHIDTKPGAAVLIESSDFSGIGHTLQNHNSRGRVDLIGNRGIRSVFYEDGATGSVVGTQGAISSVRLYDAVNVLVEANQISLLKHGEWSSGRDPVATYLLDNVIDKAEGNGGSCYRQGNSGAGSLQFCVAGTPSWHNAD